MRLRREFEEFKEYILRILYTTMHRMRIIERDRLQINKKFVNHGTTLWKLKKGLGTAHRTLKDRGIDIGFLKITVAEDGKIIHRLEKRIAALEANITKNAEYAAGETAATYGYAKSVKIQQGENTNSITRLTKMLENLRNAVVVAHKKGE